MRARLVGGLRFLLWLKVCSLMGAGIGAIFGMAWYYGAACGATGYLLGELQRRRIGARLW